MDRAPNRLQTLLRGTNRFGSIMFAKVDSWFGRGGDAAGLLSPDIAVGGTNPTIVSDPGRWIINNRGQIVAANEHCWGKQGIWNSRTNVCLRSEDITNAVWAKSNCVAAASAEAPPFAGSGVSELTVSAAALQELRQTIAATAATYGLAFTFVRKSGSYAANRQFVLNFYDNTAGVSRANSTFTINATTGVITLTATGAGAGICLEAGGGWYCCAVWATAGVVNGNNHDHYLYSVAPHFAVGEKLLVTCAQMQFGDYQLGPYIPTAGVAVARGVDAIHDTTISSALASCATSSGWAAASLCFRGNQAASNSQYVFDLCDGTTTNFIIVRVDANTGTCRMMVRVGGADQCSITRALPTGGSLCRILTTWDVNYFRFAVNNNCAVGDNAGNLLAVASEFDVGYLGSLAEQVSGILSVLLIGRGILNGISGVANDPLTGDALIVDQALQVLAGG